MKILFVSSGNTKFGISPFVKSQGESLIKEGVNVQYFKVKGKGYKAYFKAIKELRKTIRNQEFDIIHAHYTFCGLLTILARPKLPVVLSLMGDDAYGTPNNKGKTKISTYYSIILTFIIQPFFKKIIAKSAEIGTYVWQKKKLNVVPNGVNLETFYSIDKSIARKNLGLINDTKYVLFLNNTRDTRKNFVLFKETIEKEKLENFELLTPYPITPDLVVQYLCASDLLVHVSWREGSPNLIKEAMACNMPIVSSDVGDVKDILHGTKGCFITEFSTKDLAKKINLGLNFKGRTNGRDNTKHLEQSVIAKKIINIYKKILIK